MWPFRKKDDGVKDAERIETFHDRVMRQHRRQRIASSITSVVGTAFGAAALVVLGVVLFAVLYTLGAGILAAITWLAWNWSGLNLLFVGILPTPLIHLPYWAHFFLWVLVLAFKSAFIKTSSKSKE